MLLIRREPPVVFNAFIDPEITTQFWFSKSSGPLVAGETVLWEWENFGASAEVKVINVVQNQEIVIDWGTTDVPAIVTWKFTPHSCSGTIVEIQTSPFTGNEDEILKAIQDQTGGFTLVLANAKALLEHNIHLNLIADRFPDQ